MSKSLIFFKIDPLAVNTLIPVNFMESFICNPDHMITHEWFSLKIWEWGRSKSTEIETKFQINI